MRFLPTTLVRDSFRGRKHGWALLWYADDMNSTIRRYYALTIEIEAHLVFALEPCDRPVDRDVARCTCRFDLILVLRAGTSTLFDRLQAR